MINSGIGRIRLQIFSVFPCGFFLFSLSKSEEGKKETRRRDEMRRKRKEKGD